MPATNPPAPARWRHGRGRSREAAAGHGCAGLPATSARRRDGLIDLDTTKPAVEDAMRAEPGRCWRDRGLGRAAAARRPSATRQSSRDRGAHAGLGLLPPRPRSNNRASRSCGRMAPLSGPSSVTTVRPLMRQRTGQAERDALPPALDALADRLVGDRAKLGKAARYGSRRARSPPRDRARSRSRPARRHRDGIRR